MQTLANYCAISQMLLYVIKCICFPSNLCINEKAKWLFGKMMLYMINHDNMSKFKGGGGNLRSPLSLYESLDDVISVIGFPERELDTVKELVFGSNLYLLGLTFFVSFFHVMFTHTHTHTDLASSSFH